MAEEWTERVCLDERQHGAVLALPLARAFAVAVVGGGALWLGGPYAIAGAIAVCLAAVIALRAVWQWDRTRVVVTSEKLVFQRGPIRRRTTAVPLTGLPFLEVEQPLLGRLLGYGTILAGDFEITHVPGAARVYAIAAAAREREGWSTRRGSRGGKRGSAAA